MSQKESEWEEKIRVAARFRPSTEESAMDYADEAIKEVKKAIAHREKEIAEEVEKMKSKEKTSIHDFSYDMAINDVLKILNNK